MATASAATISCTRMRRNVDLTYIVMNNQIYGLTTGQVSPTSAKGMKTKSTPAGSVENPINPIPLAIAAGATYVAQGIHGPGEAHGRADQGRDSAQRVLRSSTCSVRA